MRRDGLRYWPIDAGEMILLLYICLFKSPRRLLLVRKIHFKLLFKPYKGNLHLHFKDFKSALLFSLVTYVQYTCSTFIKVQ